MNKIKLLVISLTVIMIAALTPNVMAQDVQQLENEIELHEKNIKEKESAIEELEKRIEELKAQVKELENQKKALEKELKAETKLRKDKFTTRDELVYDQEIADVLYNPYNKSDVEDALRSFEGMETKDVMKKKELIEKYGEYTKNLREFRRSSAEEQWLSQAGR